MTWTFTGVDGENNHRGERTFYEKRIPGDGIEGESRIPKVPCYEIGSHKRTFHCAREMSVGWICITSRRNLTVISVTGGWSSNPKKLKFQELADLAEKLRLL